MAGKKSRQPKNTKIRLRKPGSGRPRAYDSAPSPWAMEKRRRLAGGGDPAKTATALDILETRGLITGTQSDAGRNYGWHRRMVYGRTELRAFDPSYVAGRDSHLDDLDWERIEARYRALAAALAARGAAVRQVAEAFCLYNYAIEPLLAAGPRAAPVLELLREGLDALGAAQPRPTPAREPAVAAR